MTEHEYAGRDSDTLPDRPWYVLFHFRLPFVVPLDPDHVHVFVGRGFADPTDTDHYRDPPHVRLRLTHVKLDIRAGPPIVRAGFEEGLRAVLGPSDDATSEMPDVSPYDDESPPTQTWVEAASPATYLEGESRDVDINTTAFERCLRELNRVLRSLRTVEPGAGVRPINKEALEFVSLVEFEDEETGERAGARQFFLLHYNIGEIAPEPLTPAAEAQVFTFMELANHGHPFTRYREWADRGSDARYRRGDYEEATVCLQTAVECLFDGLIKMTAVDAGLTAAEVGDRVAKWSGPFSGLVTRYLPSILGGNWSRDSTENEVGRYWQHLYLARNRIIHAGHRTDFLEIEQAFASYWELLDFVIRRVTAQPRTLPRTMLSLVGQPELEVRGAWNRAIREFAESLDEEPNPFWAPWDVAGRTRRMGAC